MIALKPGMSKALATPPKSKSCQDKKKTIANSHLVCIKMARTIMHNNSQPLNLRHCYTISVTRHNNYSSFFGPFKAYWIFGQQNDPYSVNDLQKCRLCLFSKSARVETGKALQNKFYHFSCLPWKIRKKLHYFWQIVSNRFLGSDQIP